MNRIKLLALICLFSLCVVEAQENSSGGIYRYSINLNEIKDHKLPVTLFVPDIQENEIIFRMPKMVPGTYHIYDFGRFVSNFTAYGEDGSRLAVEMVDSSSWKISGASSLAKVTYMVRETWEPGNRFNFVFEPVGTNYEENKNYLLNTHVLFGYFDGMKRVNFEISITKPLNFYASTGMIPVYTDNTQDKFLLENYYELADMPLMYTIPDTTFVKVGETDVLVSVYSPNKNITSKSLALQIESLLNAQKNYLGGSLPVKKYAFIVYFTAQNRIGSGLFGALEHSYSSVYYYSETDEQSAVQNFVSPAAHEFFHIITPLTVHSEEVHDFDFANPVMSKHLWLYEGVTEYSAGIVLVKEGLIGSEDYLELIKNKISISQYFNDTLPFTEMSKNVLDKYHDQYTNVYQKGALIGLCLDLKLRNLSGGKYGVRNLVADLSKRFGKNDPFKDNELFDVITEMTYPEIREFFSMYVEGSKPLPLKEIFDLAGVKYAKSGKQKSFTLGQVALSLDQSTGKIIVYDTSELNEFGKEMGYEKGDELLNVNGKRIDAATYSNIVQELFANSKEGDILRMEVLRNGRIVKLKAPMMKVEKRASHLLSFDENAAESQLQIREAWLGNN